MMIVSNTTPIISLAKIGLLHLLEELFTEIIIPKGVYYREYHFVEENRKNMIY